MMMQLPEMEGTMEDKTLHGPALGKVGIDWYDLENCCMCSLRLATVWSPRCQYQSSRSSPT